MRNYIRALSVFVAVSPSAVAHANPSEDLVGTWCFYEQRAVGNVVPERVTITLNADGRYQWRDIHWKQDGSWSVQDNYLIMSNVGRHYLVSVSDRHVVMERMSTMKMRRGAC